MLWEYTICSLTVALIFSLKGFDRNTERIGRGVFLLLSSIFWVITAYGLITITWKWGGSNAVVSYTYIPTWEAWIILFSFGITGVVCGLIGVKKLMMISSEPILPPEDYDE
jgi:hypothetical protein